LLLTVDRRFVMNHPLPHNPSSTPLEYSFVDDEPEIASVPQPPSAVQIAFHAKATRSAELIAAVTGSADSDDPYEQYRQRIMQDHQRPHRDEFRANLPPPPERPDFGSAALRYESYFNSLRREAPLGYADFDEIEVPGPFANWQLSRKVMLAGCAAIIAGGALGYAMANLERLNQSTGRALAFVGSILPAGDAQASIVPAISANVGATSNTVISKKPIATASLDVADVAGALNSAIPLMLRSGGDANTQEIAIRVTGLPPAAFLSAGTRLSESAWLLRQGEETGVSLTVPAADKPKIELAIAAIEVKTGELAAPIREMTVALTDPQVTAQTTPPQQVAVQKLAAVQPQEQSVALPAAIPQPQSATVVEPAISAEAAGLLQKGDLLFKSGDLVAARQFYSRAFEMGAGAGAYGAARTYDPAVYAELKVQGLMPDAAEARGWYAKAAQAGIAKAAAAIAALPADIAVQ
jgi:hypothetical protein